MILQRLLAPKSCRQEPAGHRLPSGDWVLGAIRARGAIVLALMVGVVVSTPIALAEGSATGLTYGTRIQQLKEHLAANKLWVETKQDDGTLRRNAVTQLEVTERWHVTLYFDIPLATPEGCRHALGWLSKHTEALTRLGTVSIVTANPTVQSHQRATSSAGVLLDALAELDARHLATGQLQNSAGADQPGLSIAFVGGRDSGAARNLVATQHSKLTQWLARNPLSVPHVVLYLGDGLDSLERKPLEQRSVAESIARSGVLFIPLRPKSGIGKSGSPKSGIGSRSAEASGLHHLALRAGGRVVPSARALSTLLKELSIATTISTGPWPSEAPLGDEPSSGGPRTWGKSAILKAGGKELPFVVRKPGVHRVPTAPASSMPPATLTLLPTQEGSNSTRLQALASPRVHQVEFLVAGQLVGAASRSPFTVSLPNSIEPGTQVVAIGRDRAGAQVATESYQTATPANYSDLRVEALVLPSAAQRADRSVSFRLGVNRSLDDLASLQTTWGGLEVTPSFDEMSGLVTVKKPRGVDRDDLLVEALWKDGSRGEDAVFVGEESSERVDVHTLELLVTSGRPSTTLSAPSTASTPAEPQVDVRFQGEAFAQVRASSLHSQPIEIALLVDSSGSMSRVLEETKGQLEQFLAERNPLTRPLLIDFDEHTRSVRPLASEEDLTTALGTLSADGTTKFYEAALLACASVGKTTPYGAMIVLTDAGARDDQHLAEDLLDLALERAVPLYLLQISSEPTTSDRRWAVDERLARRSTGRLFRNLAPEAVAATLLQIESALRARVLVELDLDRPWTRDDLEALRLRIDGKPARNVLPLGAERPARSQAGRHPSRASQNEPSGAVSPTEVPSTERLTPSVYSTIDSGSGLGPK